MSVEGRRAEVVCPVSVSPPGCLNFLVQFVLVRGMLAAYMTTHLESSRSFFTDRATRDASVKASLTPLFRMAEHSR